MPSDFDSSADSRGPATWLRLGLLLIALAGHAEGTTVTRFDLGELTDSAASIFVGTCIRVDVEWIDGRIHSRYLFSASEIVKGESTAPARLEVILPGGELDGRAQYVAGMPRFEPGEETVLFLTADNAAGHAWPVGLGQGKFDVRREGQSDGRPRVYRQLTGINLVNPTPALTAKSTTDHLAVPGSDGGVDLDDFLSQVRALLPAADAGAADAAVDALK